MHIEAKYEDKIKMTDSEGGLGIYCYSSCSNQDDDFVKNARGLVYHGTDLVATSFPYADEYNETQTDELSDVFKDFKEWSFFDSYEGCVIRLFYFEGQWYLTTNKKLDAFKSFWSSRISYGKIFEEALQKEFSRNEEFALFLTNSCKDHETKVLSVFDMLKFSLDKEMQYAFLVRNTNDNRIVCRSPLENEPFLYHIGTFNSKNPNILLRDYSFGMTKPTQLFFQSLQDLQEYVKNVNHETLQGVVCFLNNIKSVKVLNSTYQKLFNIRGNEQSINFRYLQLRSDSVAVEKLKELYPKSVNTFDMYERILSQLINTLYIAYRKRYVNKEFVVLPREQFLINDTCHKKFLETGKKTTMEDIKDCINLQPATHLNKIIKSIINGE